MKHLPYTCSRKVLRVKTVLWLFAKVFWERGVIWCGTSEQSAKVFSTKIAFAKVFRLESFLLYGIIKGGIQWNSSRVDIIGDQHFVPLRASGVVVVLCNRAVKHNLATFSELSLPVCWQGRLSSS